MNACSVAWFSVDCLGFESSFLSEMPEEWLSQKAEFMLVRDLETQVMLHRWLTTMKKIRSQLAKSRSYDSNSLAIG